MAEKTILIDGAGAVLGRVATFSAKQALRGNKVVVLNCDKVIVSGNRYSTIEKYKNRRIRGGDAQKGPLFPSLSKDLVRRAIRGMLEHQKVQGARAFRRVTCYPDVPEKYSSQTKLNFKKDTPKSITLAELSRLI